ncbi:MAG: outer membrane protein assembly factor BamA [Pseudomonadota bacterium]
MGILLSPALLADEPFVIEDIQVDGLRAVTPGTAFTYIPYQVGERFTDDDATRVVRELYKTGFFTDVAVGREGNVLKVNVVERPAIAEINITGNEKVKTEDLEKALRETGLVKGRVLNPQALDRLQQELQRVYFGLGQYGARIDIKQRTLDNQRVALDIDILEGKPAKIRQISIVGNKAFKESTLLGEFELGPSPWWNFMTDSDQYSRQRLGGDLEKLRSFYLDLGYLKFVVESTQVTITPDRKDIYITINVNEGDPYRVSDVGFAGNLLLDEAELAKLVSIRKGEIFSRKDVTATTAAVQKRFGNDGYAFANVNPVPEIDEEKKEVKLVMYVDPGRRVYVRRIDFAGNFNTDEEVYRRELRQMEGAWFSTEKVDRSKERLERLSFVEQVNSQIKPVPGTTDQVDIDYSVSERLSGSFSAGVGFSQVEGVLFNVNLAQNNFLGTGNQLGLNLERSSYRQYYSLTYRDPYYTVDGVSRGFGVFFRKSDATSINLSRYLIDAYGGSVDFGVPFSEFTYGRIGLQAETQQVKRTESSPTWVDQYDGKKFNIFSLRPTWSYDSRNKALFPESGMLHQLSGVLAVPGSGLQYYSAEYDARFYLPVWKNYTVMLRGNVGTADAYGKTKDDYGQLPPFLNYYAGGIRSVRGFEDYSLGPRDSNDAPMGGAFKTVAGAELLFPIPFLDKYANSVRMSAFYDVGNVYQTASDFDAGELRQSVGVSLAWFSPIGPLSLSIAQPVIKKDIDRVQRFQFSIGAGF